MIKNIIKFLDNLSVCGIFQTLWTNWLKKLSRKNGIFFFAKPVIQGDIACEKKEVSRVWMFIYVIMLNVMLAPVQGGWHDIFDIITKETVHPSK